MIQVLVLSKYDKQAASTRHRFLQFKDILAAQGIRLELSPFFDDNYLRERFATGRANLLFVVSAIFRRLFSVLFANKYDLVILHCELIPYCPAWIEKLLLSRVSYIYDYDDAVFHMYDNHRFGVVRRFLGKKVSRIIGGAKAVMAGNQYLSDYAKQYNNTVEIIPTVVNLDRYVGHPKPLPLKPFTIGWIGSPSTSNYLVEVFEPIKEIGREGRVRFIAIGAKPFSIEGVEVEIRAWNEDKEVEDLLECDVGIMPLPDKNWARGKCAFKLIQYMACSIPVIASPIGANNDVVRVGCGLLVNGHHKLVEALRKLRDDPDLRKKMGQSGRTIVEAEYSSNFIAPKIAKLILMIYNLNKSCAV